MKKIQLLSGFIFLLFQFCFAQVETGKLTRQLDSLQRIHGLPGFAVAMVGKDGVWYQKGFGYADIEKKIPFTEKTIQNIGSISKTFIGIALMKLVEEGKISLDTEINTILPFKIVHPQAPGLPIRIAHLASHTSGIADSRMYGKSYYLKDKKDADWPYPKAASLVRRIAGNENMSLEAYLKAYLLKGGIFFDPNNFTKNPPGQTYQYSNVGATLAAYIVELVAGQPFGEYVKTQVLTKLSMNASGWHLEDVDLSAHATVYSKEREPLPKYALVTYPDGGLISSCGDLSLYLQEMIRGYAGESDLLRPESFQKMMKNWVSPEGSGEGYGLFWEVKKKGSIGHSGADPGVFTYLLFNPEKQYGQVFVTNIAAHEDKKLLNAFTEIWKHLTTYSENRNN